MYDPSLLTSFVCFTVIRLARQTMNENEQSDGIPQLFQGRVN